MKSLPKSITKLTSSLQSLTLSGNRDLPQYVAQDFYNEKEKMKSALTSYVNEMYPPQIENDELKEEIKLIKIRERSTNDENEKLKRVNLKLQTKMEEIENKYEPQKKKKKRDNEKEKEKEKEEGNNNMDHHPKKRKKHKSHK